MAKAKTWHRVDLSKPDSLRLKLGDVELPVTQCTVTYARNEIPSAQVTVSTGRNAWTAEPAAIHAAVNSLTHNTTASISLRGYGESGLTDGDGKSVPWPDEPKVIFEGDYAGHALRVTQGSFSIVIQLRHFAARLGEASAFSAVSHPSNPASLVYRGIISPSLTTGAGGAGGPTFLPQHVGYTETRSLVPTDLWAAIKGLLVAIAGQDAWDPTNGQGCLDGIMLEGSDRAKQTLGRVEGPAADFGLDYEFGKPLPLFTGGYQAVADGVAESIIKLRFESFANHTLWDMLVGHFAREYSLSVVPISDRIVVLADCPGYSKPYKTISSNRYDAVNFNPVASKPLRAVALTTSFESRTGGSVAPLETTFGGCYVSELASDRNGAVLIREPTSWLQELSRAAYDPRETLGNDELPTSTTPESQQQPAVVEVQTANQVFSRYAKQLYLENSLRSRVGSLRGPLRFDIAPGSHLRISAKSEQFFGATGQPYVDLFGEVTRVTISLDASQSTASTSFSVSHIRTETETSLKTDAHPLYDDAVVSGLPIVKGMPDGI